MKYTTDDIIDLMEEFCDVLEADSKVEQMNKEFLDADKEANKATRLFRKAAKKRLDAVISPEKFSTEERNQAFRTEEDLMNKMSDANTKAYALNDRQKELKKQGVKGVVSREFETVSSKKEPSNYTFIKVLKTNESLKLIEEIFGILEGMNLGDRIADDIYKKQQEDSDADIEKSIKRHDGRIKKSVGSIKEACELMTSLFEVDTTDTTEDTSKEQNKLKREIKDKDGNKTDVVSVEDELFPYAGNAKQQFNQKVIAKINDMIEGKATLEDLIQLVRKKHATKKIEEAEGAYSLGRVLALAEDLQSYITKHYGPMFGDKSTPKGSRLHSKAIDANTDELVDAARRELPDDEKNSSMALDRAVTALENKRAKTKNKVGELRTDIRREMKTPLSNKVYKGFFDQREERKQDAEAGYPKAIEKSIKRNKK